MKTYKTAMPIFSVLSLLFCLPIQADEIQISPFQGSTLVGDYQSRFSPLPILTEPMDAQKIPTRADVEGSLDSKIYQRPDDVSPFEIIKSYAKVLSNDGFEVLLSCEKSKNNCKTTYIISKNYGDVFKSRKYQNSTPDTIWLNFYAHHYLSAKKSTTEGTAYVVIIASDNRNLYSVDTLQVEGLEEGTVEISTKILTDKIASEGKVVLSGIFFNTGKDTITAESRPSLKTIAQYLNENPGQAFYVVGHTDDTGSLDNNVALSGKRAQAVVESLKEIGVDTSRLSGHGVGSFSPASSNGSEQGQAQNRRVELVLRLK